MGRHGCGESVHKLQKRAAEWAVCGAGTQAHSSFYYLLATVAEEKHTDKQLGETE